MLCKKPLAGGADAILLVCKKFTINEFLDFVYG